LKIQEKIDIVLCVLFQYLVEHPHETSDNRHQKMETSLTTHRSSSSILKISPLNTPHTKCLLNSNYPHTFTDTQSSPLSAPHSSFSNHPPYYPIVMITSPYPFHHSIAHPISHPYHIALSIIPSSTSPHLRPFHMPYRITYTTPPYPNILSFSASQHPLEPLPLTHLLLPQQLQTQLV
jgi:hypothetical protein